MEGPVEERPDSWRAIAALAVVGAALSLAVLPAFAVIGAAVGGTRGVVVALFAGLAAVLGGVKLAAMAWGLAAVVETPPGH